MPVFLLACLLVCFGSVSLLSAAPFPVENGEAVIKQAIVQASSSIVRIETVGGLDLVEGVLTSSGPTTGVIISSDGYIVTSSFNFAANPASVLVSLPNTEERLPAEVIARDHLKQLTLLKVEATDLTPAEPVPLKEVRVGQWAIALGRTYDPLLPNVSLGLISALERVEGKALQTDAKVSPANYGGPLVNLQGRVLGILAPLSPQSKGLTDGMNWYDSGIGFAVPLEPILENLERWKAGTDLHPGLMGVSFLSTPAFMTEPVIEEVRPNSPAAEAGLKTKDRILEAAGKPLSNVALLRKVLGQKYAEEVVPLKIQRGEEELNVELKLAQQLESFHFGWLGLLSDRHPTDEFPGLTIQQVLAGSPAEKAGLQKQDRLTALDGNSLESLVAFRQVLFLKQPGQEVQLQYRRGDEQREATLKLGEIPNEIPTEIPLPLLTGENSPPLSPEIKTGVMTVQLAGQEKTYQLYVPEDYRPTARYGCLIWLAAAGEPVPAEQLAEWKRLCRTRGFVFLRPVATELQPWSPDDTTWLLECLAETRQRYSIDQEMVCLITTGKNPAYPWQFAFEHREQIKGLIAFSLTGRFRAPFNEPGQRFLTLLACTTEKEREVQPKLQEYLQGEGFPVSLPDLSTPLKTEDFDTLGRWLTLLGSF